ncbi:MAG: short-chain dehydrogenase [Nocardia sp.]|uniref:SDR family oxidoreductase n=1 Tax=Nocardia sp. TaxID=1821 RepID=UPI00261FD1A1|nr:SDR family oxidoreductase [Nocardia sp.]MCU1648043.1 short-chain dehydrogenase [Nocardia sp.]
MTHSFDFSGQAVFVAGGTDGINLGIADAFAAAGASVAVLSRNPDKVDAAVSRLLENGGKAIGFAADVRDYEAVAAALADAHMQVGDIDILVSGAAGNFPAPAMGLSSNGFRTVIEIDLIGTFNVLRAAFEHLRKPGASIINISAPQSSIPMEMQIHACSAKAGVDMVTRVAALEWGPLGVRVNAVLPGPISGTEGMARLAPTPDAEHVVARSIPLGRYGTKQEIADCCLWLASPMASYVSGATIPVDGGWALGGASAVYPDLRRLFSGQH